MDPTSKSATERYRDAMADAVRAAEELTRQGRDDRAAGLAVGVDLGIAAALLFDVSDSSIDQATATIREAIDHAFREED